MTTSQQNPPATAPAVAAVSPQAALGLLFLRPLLLFVSFGILWTLPTAGERGDNLIWQNVAIVVVDIVSLLAAAALLRRAGGTLRQLIAPRRSDIGWGLLAGLIVIVGFFAATFVANLVVYQGAPPAQTGPAPTVPLWFGLWCLIVMPVTIAFAEEVVYRGVGQGSLTAHWGRWPGLLVTAAIFGFQHLALTAPDGPAWLARFLTTFLAGLMFGLLVWWFKRLNPLIIGHWLLDVLGLGLPMFLLAIGAL